MIYFQDKLFKVLQIFFYDSNAIIYVMDSTLRFPYQYVMNRTLMSDIKFMIRKAIILFSEYFKKKT